MRTSIVSLLLFGLLLLVSDAPSYARPEIAVTYSHRQMAEGEADPELPEGSYIATFTAQEIARPIDPPEGWVQLSQTEWQYVFPWNWDPLEIRFFDASAETVTISASPQHRFTFEPALHDIPVINVQTDSTNFWDPDLGIFVFGNYDNCLQRGDLWERPARWQFYDQASTPLFDQDIGLRINGGSGRAYPQKGLRFYFDDYGSTDEIIHDFFGSSPLSFRRLIIRPGRTTSENLSSGLFDNLFYDLGHLTSRWAAVGVYLNQEYWGYYSLRERIDEQFIEHTYNLANDNYVLMKDGESVHGDTSSWWNFLDSCAEAQSSSSHHWYLAAQETVDLSSYIDWLLVNIYGAATDNGSQYNLAMYKIGGGPWHFIPWDEDGLLNWVNYDHNFFRFLSVGSMQDYWEFKPEYVWSGSAEERIRWAAPFRALMQNSEFKARFHDRYWELHHGPMSATAMTNRLAEIVSIQSSEMEKHYARWRLEGVEHYHQVVHMKQDWIDQRWELLDEQFADFMELYRVPVELSEFSASLESSGDVQLIWSTASQEQVAGFLLYSGTQADDLQEIASWHNDASLSGQNGIWQRTDYSFFHENATTTEDTLYYQLAWENTEGTLTFLDWHLNLPCTVVPQLFINEFLASNYHTNTDEAGEFDDWLEIFNAGPGPAELGGLFLTDDLAIATKWQFPEYQLGMGEHLLVWCDDDPMDGPMHASFKLSAGGEEIGLFRSVAGGYSIVDSVVFGQQMSDISQGRQWDGDAHWISFISPTPGTENAAASSVIPEPTGFRLESAYPNPFNPCTKFRCFLPEAASVELGIYDVMGKRIATLVQGQVLSAGAHTFTWNGTDNMGNGVATGVYLVHLATPNFNASTKLVLVQ